MSTTKDPIDELSDKVEDGPDDEILKTTPPTKPARKQKNKKRAKFKKIVKTAVIIAGVAAVAATAVIAPPVAVKGGGVLLATAGK